MFDNGAAITATRDGTNTLDLGAGGDEIEKTFSLVVQGHDLVGSTGKIKVDVQTSDSESTGYSTLCTFDEVTVPNANATGFVVKHGIIPYGIKRYLKVHYTVTNAITAGTIDAFLTRSREIK